MVQFGETAGDSVCRCTLPVRVENRMPTRDEVTEPSSQELWETRP